MTSLNLFRRASREDDAYARMRALNAAALSDAKSTEMGATLSRLFATVVPTLAVRSVAAIEADFAAYASILGCTDEIELVEIESFEKLQDLVYGLTGAYIVHVDDEFTLSVDRQLNVAAIAVHNKGSAWGRVLTIPIWRSERCYFSCR